MAAIHFGPQEECNAHIRKQLGQLAEPKFQQFMAKLLPGVENILGVCLPMLRALAKQLAKKIGRAHV